MSEQRMVPNTPGGITCFDALSLIGRLGSADDLGQCVIQNVGEVVRRGVRARVAVELVDGVVFRVVCVVAVFAMECVATGSADELVVAVSAVQAIISRAAVEAIVGVRTVEPIVAGHAVEEVATARPGEGVALVAAGEQIASAAAECVRGRRVKVERDRVVAIEAVRLNARDAGAGEVVNDAVARHDELRRGLLDQNVVVSGAAAHNQGWAYDLPAKGRYVDVVRLRIGVDGPVVGREHNLIHSAIGHRRCSA